MTRSDAIPTQPGLVVFAEDLERVAAFYRAVLGLQTADADAQHVLLRSEHLELVVHRMAPRHVSARQGGQGDGVPAGKSSRRVPPRTEAAIKPTFMVDSLQAVRAAATATGGHLKPQSAAWRFRGLVVLDGWDPEGNVLQFRQPDPEAA